LLPCVATPADAKNWHRRAIPHHFASSRPPTAVPISLRIIRRHLAPSSHQTTSCQAAVAAADLHQRFPQQQIDKHGGLHIQVNMLIR
jgi:hypothetical protein